MSKRKKTKNFIRQSATKNLPTLRIIPLGGLEEVGRNMTVFEYLPSDRQTADIIIVDMGLQFPEEDMPGIDYIIPNINYLKDKIKNVRGVILTHGHLDHIGALPHLISKLGNPLIIGTELTINLVKKRQEDYKNNKQNLNFKIINPESKITLGRFKIEFFHINHNIPGSLGVVIQTPIGNIVHSGDWKFDHNPVDEKPTDFSHLAEIGKGGVLALLSDSTNAGEPGSQISEIEIGKTLKEIFQKVPGRIIIGTFSSLLSRIKQIIDLANEMDKIVAIDGYSMKTNLEIAKKLGYIKPKPGILIEIKDIDNYPKNKIIIIGTGAQGEGRAVLMRIANKEHRFIKIQPDDTIIFSSSVVPGNERSIQKLKDIFSRQGAEVIHYQMMDVHAGGHAKADDVKLMLQLLKPKYFIPIEGSHYMLKLNAKVAENLSFDKKNIIISDNGQIIECFNNQCRLTNKKVPADYVFVDGLGVGDVSHIVLRDRNMMAADGMLVVIATIDTKNGKLIHNPDLISRGFIYMKENKTLVEETRKKVKKMFKGKLKNGIDENYFKNKIRNDIGQFLYSKTQRRPMILPVIIKV